MCEKIDLSFERAYLLVCLRHLLPQYALMRTRMILVLPLWVHVRYRWLIRLMHLKGRNFLGKKISRISAKFAKIHFFFDCPKCRYAKINFREIFQNWRFAKINSRKIFQELMKCEYWSFCLIQCLLNQVFSRPSAIYSFV